jgi:hypothetical protein
MRSRMQTRHRARMVKRDRAAYSARRTAARDPAR